MNCPREVRLSLARVPAIFIVLAAASVAWAQFRDAPPPAVGPVPFRAQPGGAAPAEVDQPDDPAGVIDTNTRPVTPIGPREIRLNLTDGNVIAGEVSIDEITVETDFGPLQVPINKIRNFHPGLDSYPAVSARLDKLIADLGGDDYATREDAHKQLVQWGLPIRALLAQASDGDNAERKRHLTGILAELEEQAGDADDEEEPLRSLIRRDTVETTEFTIVGRIVQQEFKVASKYGELTVKLADIDTGDRAYGAAEPINRKLSLDGTYIAQQQFKSSGIRLKAGDKVSVRADGQLIMTPWGTNYTSTPEGGTNYGWYIPNDIPGGALVAKIGNSGKVFKVGSKFTFTAKSAGVLMFSIGMDNNYAGEGYSYPGKYDVRVKVEPQ
jgi:hypothetical protein